MNVRLAPVYDMLSTAPYLPRDIMALELDGSKAYPARQQLIRFARQSCGLSKQNAETVLASVARGVAEAVAEMQAYAARHQDFQGSADHFARVFSDGLSRGLDQ